MSDQQSSEAFQVARFYEAVARRYGRRAEQLATDYPGMGRALCRRGLEACDGASEILERIGHTDSVLFANAGMTRRKLSALLERLTGTDAGGGRVDEAGAGHGE